MRDTTTHLWIVGLPDQAVGAPLPLRWSGEAADSTSAGSCVDEKACRVPATQKALGLVHHHHHRHRHHLLATSPATAVFSSNARAGNSTLHMGTKRSMHESVCVCVCSVCVGASLSLCVCMCSVCVGASLSLCVCMCCVCVGASLSVG